jgi:calcineurin-like phosphoesterase family protein
MDEEMVKRWNEVVRPDDKVYHLGDVVINLKKLPIMHRLNGNKRLIRGNHDIGKTKDYIEAGFKEIYGVRVLDKMVLTHVPLHPESITQRWNVRSLSVCLSPIRFTLTFLSSRSTIVLSNLVS